MNERGNGTYFLDKLSNSLDNAIVGDNIGKLKWGAAANILTNN